MIKDSIRKKSDIHSFQKNFSRYFINSMMILTQLWEMLCSISWLSSTIQSVPDVLTTFAYDRG